MRILVTGTNTRAVTRQKNHMIPYQDTCIRFMKTIMMHFATGPTHENAGAVSIKKRRGCTAGSRHRGYIFTREAFRGRSGPAGCRLLPVHSL